ncbi:flavin reductase family protein [Streptomyces uncialis]|uniref:flavin reductase family protein n=1 Tax=Streptomyces uncialis TaxID=1048205 RepID=UPI0033D856A7
MTPIRSAEPGAAGDDGTDPGAFRDAMRHWATGVAVITTRSPLGPHGMTVNSLLSVSLDPPTLLISLKRGSRTQGVVERTGRFTVNVLAADQRALADRFTRRRVFGDEEFRGLCHRPSPGGGGPELEGSAVVLGCRVTRQVEVADHVLVVARVTGVRVPSADGLRGPLLYAGRSYRSLAEREGAAGGNTGLGREAGGIAELPGPPGRG